MTDFNTWFRATYPAVPMQSREYQIAKAAWEARAPKVKALHWVKSYHPSWDGDFHTVPTLMTIRGADEWGYKLSWQGGTSYHTSPEAAKSAAQADYESRILEALE